MRAICWHGKADVRLDTVPDPTIESPRDCVIRATATAICGSDLYDGYMRFGALMNKGLTLKTGQTHTQRYMRPLLSLIERGQIDPSFVVTYRLPLADGPAA